jgi:multisubunit Na+/H+ antiporter MnhB subunit
MKESDKNIENLIDKMMAESNLESPSIDFTSRIMAQILAAEKSKIKAYKPLISKQTWSLIIGGLIVLFICSFMTGGEYDMRINRFYTEKVSDLYSGKDISKNILYAILIVPLMVLIQIPLLKKYYNNRYQL